MEGDVHHVVTLAYMVEKEAKVAERPQVAAVYANVCIGR
jgi:cell division protein YceG involved in septum cleavage